MTRVGSKVTWRDSASMVDKKLLVLVAIMSSKQEQGLHTASSPRAYSSIPRIRGIATNVSHLRIQQPFVLEMLAEEVLHAPEAARGHSTFLSVVRDLCGRFGVEG